MTSQTENESLDITQFALRETSQRPKFAVIQAVRGFASLWVVLFHLEKSGAINSLTAELPAWLAFSVFSYGNAGVAVFFVLSGFVIAHSLNGKSMSGAALGQFAARRSVRLDPPYWTSILLVVAIDLTMTLAHGRSMVFPSAGQVGIHLLYLQEVMNIPEIQIVYWTLTYEIQFYLIFAVSIWAGQRSGRPRIFEYALFGLALVSALLASEWAPHGLFVNRWHGFMLGVLAYRAGVHRTSIWAFALLVVVAAYGASTTPDVFGTPCAIAAFSLYLAARCNVLTEGLRARPWQLLGAISYSLYLVHVPMIRLPMGIWQSAVGRGFWSDTGFAIVAMFASIGCASVLYLFVEKPSHRLAQRLFRKENRTTEKSVDHPSREPGGPAF